MTLALIGTVLLVVLVFAFVLEPVLLAKPDEIVVDAIPLPDIGSDEAEDAFGPDPDDPLDETEVVVEGRAASGRIADRPAGDAP